MSLETVTMVRRVCDACYMLGQPNMVALTDTGWEQDTYNGHEIDVCPRHRYGYSDRDKEQLAMRYPNPA